jgi:hypothetical protein
MADITFYLEPGHGGTDVGTESNPFASWASCIAHLNTLNFITLEQTCDVIVRGATVSTGASIAWTFVCNETFFVRFVGDPAQRVPGVYDAAAPGCILNYASPTPFFFDSTGQFVVGFVGLNFEGVGGGSTSARYGIEFNANIGAGSRIFFDGCYFKGFENASSGGRAFLHLNRAAVVANIENCIAEGFTTTAGTNCLYFDVRASSDGTKVVANCTFINSPVVISRLTTAIIIGVNNLFVDSATGALHANSGYNASTAASGLAGSNNTYNISAEGLFVSSTDRHLAAPNAWGAGPDNETYGEFVPLYDIDGDERTGLTASAGADEPASGGGGPAIQSGEFINATTEGFQIRFETNTANGTAYYVVYPTAVSDPTAAQIQSGIDWPDAIAVGSMAISTTGQQTFPAVTGLDPNTTYRVAVVHYGIPA